MNTTRNEEKHRSWWRRGWFYYSVPEHFRIRGAEKPAGKARDPIILELRRQQGTEPFSKHDLLDWASKAAGGKEKRFFNDASLALIVVVAIICLLGGIWAGYRWHTILIQRFSPWLMVPLLLHLLWAGLVFGYYTVALLSKRSGLWFKTLLSKLLSPLGSLLNIIKQVFAQIEGWAKNKPKGHIANVIANFWRNVRSYALIESPALKQMLLIHVKWPKNLRWLALWFGALIGLSIISYDAPHGEVYSWNPDTPRHQDQFMNIIQMALPSTARIDERVLRWSNTNWHNKVMFDDPAWMLSSTFRIVQGSRAADLLYGLEDEVTISVVLGDPEPTNFYFRLKQGQWRSVSGPDFQLRAKASALDGNLTVVNVTVAPDSLVELEIRERNGGFWFHSTPAAQSPLFLRDDEGNVRDINAWQQALESPLQPARWEIMAGPDGATPIAWLDVAVKPLPRTAVITEPDNAASQWRSFFRSLVWYYGVVPRLFIFLPIFGLYIKARHAIWVELNAKDYTDIIKWVNEPDPPPVTETETTEVWPPPPHPPPPPPPPPPVRDAGGILIAKYNLILSEKDSRGMLPAPEQREGADYHDQFLGTPGKSKPFLKKLQKLKASVVYLYANFDFTPDDDFKSLAKAIGQEGAHLHVVLLKRDTFVENRGEHAANDRETVWRDALPEANIEVIG